MADIWVRGPDGAVYTVSQEEYQSALNQGFTNLSADEAKAAQHSEINDIGQGEAVSQGLLKAPEDYSRGLAFAERVGSNLTFGQADALNTPAARARGKAYEAEHPVGTFGADVIGGLPYAVAGTAAAGAVAGAAGLGALGAGALDLGVGAAIGGAQTEGEETRLSGEDFSWTDAAITGVAGEVLGRGAVWGVSKALGGSRNLLAKATREVVAGDTEASLAKGGWLNDYRVAQHADQYHGELAELAARDLDTLEESFAEVSRQDRKRARITRVVADNPEVQGSIRVEALQNLTALRDALGDELSDAGGPARKLLKQLDDRIVALEDGRSGKKLWRTLDENRQALQEYRQDLYQAYESNPGSAWLSREGLTAIDQAEKATREALLREDAWGAAAAAMQKEYNVPFHEKYFPTAKTIRQDLMFSPSRNAEGFAQYRGDPAKVRRFLARDAADPDAHRLSEQFRDYLDGVEAIARAGEKDTPQASAKTLEAVRRLRKAVSNAAYISEAAARTRNRSGLVTSGVEIAGAVGAGVAAGPGAGALGYAALRGARVGDFLHRAGQRLGWGAGRALSMADLLAKDAHVIPAEADAKFVDDLFDAPSGPPRPPTEPPSGPPGPRGGGLTPSMRAAAADPNWAPTPAPESGVSMRPGATAADDLADAAPDADEALAMAGRESRSERAARLTVPTPGREVGRGQVERLELDGLRDARGPAQREAKRLEALTEGEFRDVVRQLRASDAPEAAEFASELEKHAEELVDDGLVAPGRPTQLTRDVDDLRAAIADFPEGATAADLRDALGMDSDTFGRAFMDLRSAGDVDLREGRIYLRAAEAPEAKAAAQAFDNMGVQVRMGAERLPETLEHVFAGSAPTPEQWQRIIPLNVLEGIAPVEKARIDVLGDAFIWSAEGKSSLVQPHNSPAGLFDPGGYQDQSWSISRTFSRDEKGRLEVHHDHFMVRGDLQGSGAGAKALREMMDVYREIGVDVVTVDSVEVGKYFWPSIGFNHPDQRVVDSAVKAYREWLVASRGLSADAAAASVKGIRSLPALAQAEYGKEFLLSETGNWNFGLRLDLSDANPMYHLMRGRLDIAAAAVAGLGSMWEGERKEDGQTPTSAAAVGGMALFGRRVGLFKSVRAKLVADVAKRLFSATAEPAARVVSRLAYNRVQMAARQEEFQSWATDPNSLVERVAEGFRDVPPEHSGTVASGVFRTATFLKQRLPTVTKLNAVSLRRIPVSAEAMAKYARFEQAALRPREALQEAASSGHLSAELLETLGELYPDLLAEQRVAAIMQVRENGPPTSVQAKLSYARLFDMRGELADPSMSQTVANMTALAYEQATPTKPGGGPTSSGNVSHVAAASAAPKMGLTG